MMVLPSLRSLWRSLLTPGGGLALLALFVGGCSDPMPPDQAEAIANTVIEGLDGPKAAFFKPATTTRSVPYRLHVDMSVNMVGFFDTPESSTLVKLIRGMNQRKAGAIEFQAFGTLPEGEEVQTESDIAIDALLKPASYRRTDSDFAAVIEGFAAESEFTHMIVSDGQQWNKKTLADYSKIKCAAGDFLKRGGEIALLVFRSPYKGPYSSSVLARRPEAVGKPYYKVVDYDVPDRPFILWVFLRRDDTLENLLDVLKLEQVTPAYTFRMRGNDIAIAPRTAASVSTTKGAREIVPFRLRDGDVFYPADLRPYATYLVNYQAVREDGYLPMQFELLPSPEFQTGIASESPEAACRWIVENIQPRLQCWTLKKEKTGRWAVDKEVELNRKLLPNGLLYDMAIVTPSGTKGLGASPSVRVTLQVQKPVKTARRYAWVLTLDLQKRYGDALLPEEYSTDDDSTPESAQRVLNLRPMMGTVLEGACVPGRSFFLTEWR